MFDFSTIATLVAMLGGGFGWISLQLQDMRRESSAGRQALYERIEKLRKEISDGYISRELHTSEFRRLEQRIDELMQQVADVSGRIDRRAA